MVESAGRFNTSGLCGLYDRQFKDNGAGSAEPEQDRG